MTGWFFLIYNDKMYKTIGMPIFTHKEIIKKKKNFL